MTLTMNPTEAETWAEAHCVRAGVDPNVMQPERATRAEVEEAKAICGGCPRFLQCLEHAKDQGVGAYGVHAGQWWGAPPVWLVSHECERDGCTVTFEHEEGRPRAYCSNRCRAAAYAARQSVSA